MRIPDLSKMVVNTKVHEAMVSRVSGEAWQKTGYLESLQAGLILMPDPLSRLLNQPTWITRQMHMAEKFRHLDQTMTEGGQPALVRVDAFPDKILKGHVKSVATVASQQDWMSADVKVYQTMVSIDEPLEGLKPGMSAEVTVFTDTHRESVLAVPIQSILGSVDMGPTRRVFVITPQGPQMRDVTVGLSNDKMAEIESGLVEGDEVVVNPRVLLSEKEKSKYGETVVPKSGRSGMGGPEGGEKGKGGKGKGDKGKGGKAPWPGKDGPPAGGPPV